MTFRLSTLALGISAIGLAFASPALAAHPLDTAIVAGGPYYGRDGDLAFDRTRAAGADTIRLQLSWREVSPQQSTRPPGFDPSNPADPAYNWSEIDWLVRLAAENGLEPFVSINTAPPWAESVMGGRAGNESARPGRARALCRGGRPALQRQLRRPAACAGLGGLERAQRQLLPVSAVRDQLGRPLPADGQRDRPGRARRALRQPRRGRRPVPVRPAPAGSTGRRAAALHAEAALPFAAVACDRQLRRAQCSSTSGATTPTRPAVPPTGPRTRPACRSRSCRACGRC